MYEWQKQIQVIVDQIGQCIKNHDDEALTLHCLSGRLGYSEFHTTRKFKEISGMQFRDYLRRRKLAFALKEVRDSDKSMLYSIVGKLDDHGGSECNSGSGQVMAYINDPEGRLCDWGIERTECYGVRLPMDYKGGVPPQMLMADVLEAEYIVFEHGPFDYEQENRSVEEQIEKAMAAFDFTGTGYCYDTAPGRIIYMYFNPEQFFKYIRPVRK
ncbi:MAG: hypothetical protein ACLTXE_03925 [Enterocloster aldenensis]